MPIQCIYNAYKMHIKYILEVGGVVPTGKSISVSVAVALRACVRAKLCAGV